MSAFFIFDHLGTKDQAGVDRYIREAPATVRAFGGKYRVIYGKHTVIEGTGWQPKALVMLEFPSMEKAEAWYNSDMYKELKALRLASADSNGVLIEGFKLPLIARLMAPFLGKNAPPPT